MRCSCVRRQPATHVRLAPISVALDELDVPDSPLRVSVVRIDLQPAQVLLLRVYRPLVPSASVE